MSVSQFPAIYISRYLRFIVHSVQHQLILSRDPLPASSPCYHWYPVSCDRRMRSALSSQLSVGRATRAGSHIIALVSPAERRPCRTQSSRLFAPFSSVSIYIIVFSLAIPVILTCLLEIQHIYTNGFNKNVFSIFQLLFYSS